MNQPLIILGAGESGTGAALLAISKGLEVFVSDNKKIKDKYRKILIDNRISFEEEKHSKEIIEKADEIIISPGISKDTELLRNIKQKGINIISEIEFANRYSKAKKIAITGSNGKTTTTLLTHHILQKAGLDVAVAGNVGKSFAASLAERDYEYYVLEISSFQLDDIINFKPDISVLLNITPDHLDRYEYNFNNYINSKFKIISNQNEKDCFVYCLDDTTINKEIKNK
ncbi:MAG: UDP-N-acetylmuramoyl-L-alanine--D-glutamate ligase, partial [Bacteroidales bacterium]|nr:UDP-N-acetylmuramoyl-L-alanine--D-glutamate ligase [Bacteroidales bacterium]